MSIAGDHDAEPAATSGIGEELQRRVPKPSRRVPPWLHPEEPVSEKRELVEGAIAAVGHVGPLGLVVAIPAAVISWMRNRRR